MNASSRQYLRLRQLEVVVDIQIKGINTDVPPNIKERVRLKIPEESGTIGELLRKQSQALGLPLVATGTSSVGQYAVMQRGDLLSIYCPRLEMLLEVLPGSQTDRFPNLELMETEDETVYFDVRQEGDFSLTVYVFNGI